MTVSRCMNARAFGSSTARTCRAAPSAKRRRASSSTICGAAELGAGQPADEVPRQGCGLQLLEEVSDWTDERRPQVVLGDSPVEQPLACLVELESLGQQLGEQQHLHAGVTQRVGEGVVLL